MRMQQPANHYDFPRVFYRNASRVALATLFLFTLIAWPSAALTPEEERGYEIAAEWDRRDSGWEDQSAELQMILRNRHGQESKRELRNRSLEVNGDGDKLLIVFDEPRDVKGTNFLTFTHKSGPDDRWIYLPALKRIKRIASNNKSGPFMGSEFSYEDLASQELEKYTYRFLREETLSGRDAYVVERISLDSKSGYTRQEVWYDKQTYRPEQIKYYDRKGELLKTLRFSKYNQHLGQYWRADEMFMENHQTGKSTLLVWHNYEFRTGLTDRDFHRNSLRRAR